MEFKMINLNDGGSPSPSLECPCTAVKNNKIWTKFISGYRKESLQFKVASPYLYNLKKKYVLSFIFQITHHKNQRVILQSKQVLRFLIHKNKSDSDFYQEFIHKHIRLKIPPHITQIANSKKNNNCIGQTKSESKKYI